MDKCGCEVITMRISGGKLKNEAYLKDFGSSVDSSDFLLKVLVGDCIILKIFLRYRRTIPIQDRLT